MDGLYTVTGSAIGLLVGLGSAVQPTLAEDPPDTIELTGIIRDFRERTAENGTNMHAARLPTGLK